MIFVIDSKWNHIIVCNFLKCFVCRSSILHCFQHIFPIMYWRTYALYGYGVTCPHPSHVTLIEKGYCSKISKTRYVCLHDITRGGYTENCSNLLDTEIYTGPGKYNTCVCYWKNSSSRRYQRDYKIFQPFGQKLVYMYLICHHVRLTLEYCLISQLIILKICITLSKTLC